MDIKTEPYIPETGELAVTPPPKGLRSLRKVLGLKPRTEPFKTDRVLIHHSSSSTVPWGFTGMSSRLTDGSVSGTIGLVTDFGPDRYQDHYMMVLVETFRRF